MSENWVLITHADDGTPMDHAYFIEKLAERLRSKWKQTDRVVLEYKHGAKWRRTGMGIAMPEDAESLSAEDGAAHLVRMASELDDKFDGKGSIRAHALGESQSGATIKTLWTLGIDFNNDGDTFDDKTNVAASKQSEAAAYNELIRQTMEDMRRDRKAATDQTTALGDRIVKMSETVAEQAAKHWEGYAKIREMELREDRKRRKAEEKAREDEVSDRRFDRFFDEILGRGGSLLEQYLANRMGMGDTMDGTYSDRLAAILKRIPEEKQAAAREILGDKAWELLRRAADNVPDQGFRELARQAAGALNGDHAEIMKRLALELQDPNLVMALAKLWKDATE